MQGKCEVEQKNGWQLKVDYFHNLDGPRAQSPDVVITYKLGLYSEEKQQ